MQDVGDLNGVLGVPFSSVVLMSCSLLALFCSALFETQSVDAAA